MSTSWHSDFKHDYYDKSNKPSSIVINLNAQSY